MTHVFTKLAASRKTRFVDGERLAQLTGYPVRSDYMQSGETEEVHDC